MSDTIQDTTEMLFWIIEQSATDKGEMLYLAEQAIEELTNDLAKALTV